MDLYGDVAERSETMLQAGSDVIFEIACIPCRRDGKDSDACGYCIECCEHLCDDCIRSHRRFGMFKQHKVVDKDNMPKNQTAVPHVDTCTKRCQIHSDEVIAYFCPTHKVLGCSVCVTLKHRLCQDMEYIPEVAKDLENSRDYKEFQSKLNSLTRTAQDVIDYAKENLEYSNGQSTYALQDIESFRQKFNSQLDKIEGEIKRKATEIKERDFSRFESVINKSEEVLKQLNGISSEFETLQKNKQLCQMFTSLKDNGSKLSDLEDVLKQIQDDKMSYYKFIPNEELQTIFESMDGLGKLCLRDAKDIKAVHKMDICVGSPIRGLFSLGMTGATLISPDKFVIADYTSKCVKLIDTVGKKVTTEFRLQSIPWDVAVVNNKQFAVTLPHKERIVFLTYDTSDIIRDTDMSVQGRCEGLTCYKNKLFVSFGEQKKIEILNMTGEVLRIIKTNDKGERLFQEPMYVAVSPNGLYMYVSDWQGKAMIKIDMDGNVVSKYTDSELRAPSKVIFDKAGLIYLCSRGSKDVLLLSPECKELKRLLTKSDGMDEPSFSCYCDITEQLYVGLACDRVVKVYQLLTNHDGTD